MKLAIWPTQREKYNDMGLMLICLEISDTKSVTSHGWPLDAELTLTLKGCYADDFQITSGKLGSIAAPVMKKVPELNDTSRKVYGPWAVPLTLCYLFGKKHDKIHLTIDMEIEGKGKGGVRDKAHTHTGVEIEDKRKAKTE